MLLIFSLIAIAVVAFIWLRRSGHHGGNRGGHHSSHGSDRGGHGSHQSRHKGGGGCH